MRACVRALARIKTLLVAVGNVLVVVDVVITIRQP